MSSIKIHNQDQNAEGSGWWQSIDISGKDLNHVTIKGWGGNISYIVKLARCWNSETTDWVWSLDACFYTRLRGHGINCDIYECFNHAAWMSSAWALHDTCDLSESTSNPGHADMRFEYCILLQLQWQSYGKLQWCLSSVTTAVGSGRLVTSLNRRWALANLTYSLVVARNRTEVDECLLNLLPVHRTEGGVMPTGPAACACLYRTEGGVLHLQTCCFLNLHSGNSTLQRHAFL